MDIAKEMTREALPIKCLEAVILGMYLLITTAADRALGTISVLFQVFPSPCVCPVTSPTACLAWSVSPSASSLGSQGTTSITSCWGSTAGDASGRWGSAGGRTSCSSPWSCGRWRSWCRTSKEPTEATGTSCARWGSASTCPTTLTAWSRSSGNIPSWMWKSWQRMSCEKSWRDTLETWGWRYSTTNILTTTNVSFYVFYTFSLSFHCWQLMQNTQQRKLPPLPFC